MTIQDPSWGASDIVAWTTAEVMTGVIIAALSTLRPLVARYVPGWATRSGGTSAGASYTLRTLPSTIASHSDRKSTFIASPRSINSGGWLDMEEAEQADIIGKYGGASLRYPMPVRLSPGMGRSVGSIRVTKEWSVEDDFTKPLQSDTEDGPQVFGRGGI